VDKLLFRDLPGVMVLVVLAGLMLAAPRAGACVMAIVRITMVVGRYDATVLVPTL